MKYLPAPIIYLEDKDFDSNGQLIAPLLASNSKPIFIMFQANFCFHCTDAKPAFYNFATKNMNRVICATVQGDSDLPTIKALRQKINSIYPNLKGFPSYMVVYNGKKIIYDSGRDEKSLTNFLNNLLNNEI